MTIENEYSTNFHVHCPGISLQTGMLSANRASPYIEAFCIVKCSPAGTSNLCFLFWLRFAVKMAPIAILAMASAIAVCVGIARHALLWLRCSSFWLLELWHVIKHVCHLIGKAQGGTVGSAPNMQPVAFLQRPDLGVG